MPEPIVYPAGYVKHHPETNEVAIRTIFPADAGRPPGNMMWLIATSSSGARNTTSAEVESDGWVDLYDPSAGS